MRAVCCFDSDTNSCPVNDYLSQYYIEENDNKLVIKQKQNILGNIDEKIRYAVQVQGRPEVGFLKSLKTFSFFEIRQRKNSKLLIRICYFRHYELIVLLHAFEKSDSYTDKKTKKEVDHELKLANKYYHDFKSNPTLYEEYE
jgi:phage-related protein